MKNLPATIGILLILTILFLFRSRPDNQLKAAVLNNNEAVQIDTIPHKMLDTVSPVKHGKKKDWKKKDKDSTWKKDSMR
ncbi:hypothetical protein CLV51_104212 [Chitinophaga niastensis]|uniref:Uncharacterized protein n=1 Tax=Chitinophaga niastensis TaxID=536980 RepID=A0A2P8HH26_CHINA|nr:hypothetical protein [Chitinophaga niastensis]PSL45507.1 hypothetical protein CLV51_104212 [Chitinophaga niastensis]